MSNIPEASQTISPDTLKSQYVNPKTCRFFNAGTGIIGADIDGTEYRRVILTRSLPLTDPESYICITNTEKKELGIIEHISDFDADQIEIIRSELNQRYFSPVLSEITSIKEKFGNFYIDAKVGNFEKRFTVKDLNKSIRYHGKGFDIIDIDGNRFRIEDYDRFPAKSRRKLEPYLY